MKDGSETVLPGKRSAPPVSQRSDTTAVQKAAARGQWRLALGQRGPATPPSSGEAKSSPAVPKLPKAGDLASDTLFRPEIDTALLFIFHTHRFMSFDPDRLMGQTDTVSPISQSRTGRSLKFPLIPACLDRKKKKEEKMLWGQMFGHLIPSLGHLCL